MPSFEETNQADQDNPDFQYKPGNQKDLKKSDVVVKNSAEASPTEVEPVPVKQEKRTRVPAELKPDVLDASIPLPKPAPLQKTKVQKFEDPDAAKKPNLRSRWKSDSSNESEPKAQSFGQVDDLTKVQENLSGRPSRPPKKRAKQTMLGLTQGDLEKPENNSEMKEQNGAKPKRSRNRKRKNPSDSQHRDNNKRSEGGSSNAKKTARKQANKKTSSKSAQKPKTKQPMGIVGKIVKTIQGLFGDVEKSKPEPSRPQRKRPAKKTSSHPQTTPRRKASKQYRKQRRSTTCKETSSASQTSKQQKASRW